MVEPSPQLLTVSDAARMLSVSPKVVRRLIKTGELPAVSLGVKLTRIKGEALAAFISKLPSLNNPSVPIKAQKDTRKAPNLTIDADKALLAHLQQAGLIRHT